jgi:hypothetical protein
MITDEKIIKLKSIACWFDTEKLLIYSNADNDMIDYENYTHILSLNSEWFTQLTVEERQLISNYINKK